MSPPRFYILTKKADLVRRCATRVGFCTVPYLVLALLWSAYRDDRLLHGLGFWLCVVVIPLAGLLVDAWRLQQTRIREKATA